MSNSVYAHFDKDNKTYDVKTEHGECIYHGDADQTFNWLVNSGYEQVSDSIVWLKSD